jgi:hypothetical protein
MQVVDRQSLSIQGNVSTRDDNYIRRAFGSSVFPGSGDADADAERVMRRCY